jgi:hypothetical protein
MEEKKGRIEKKCLQCGDKFSLVYSKKETRKFCLRPCVLEYRKRFPIKPWLGKKMSEAHRKKLSESRTGKKSHFWKGGRVFDKDGYILVLQKDHPNANPNGYVREHRLVVEKHLGRFLLSNEVVHHKNHKRDDNSIENLQLFSEHSLHIKEEWKNEARKPYIKYKNFICKCGSTSHYAKGCCENCYHKSRYTPSA